MNPEDYRHRAETYDRRAQDEATSVSPFREENQATLREGARQARNTAATLEKRRRLRQ